MVHTIDEFIAADREIVQQSTVRLYRGQRQDWPILPLLFRNTRFERVEEITRRERELLRSFQDQGAPFLPSIPTDNWGWLSLAISVPRRPWFAFI